MIADLGLTAAIVQYQDLDEAELNTCFYLSLVLTLTAYGVLFAAAPWLADWFHSPELTAVLRVAALSLPVIALRQVPESLLRRRLQLDRIAQAEIVGTLVIIPVTLGLAWAGAGVWALVTGSLVQTIMFNIVITWFSRWRPSLTVGSRRLGELLRYSASALGARVSWSLYEQVDVFVLGRFASETSLGMYSMARQLASMPVTKVSVVVNQLAMPVMARLQSDIVAMRQSFFRVVRMVGCVTIPLCVVLATEADDVVTVALASKWRDMAPLLQLFAVGALLRWLEVLLPPVLFARYRTAFVFWWTMAVLICMPFVFWAGAQSAGALGVAWAWVAVYPLFVLWMARESLKELGVGWTAIWAEVRPIAGAAVIMALCIVAVRSSVPSETEGAALGRLVAASGMGLLVYAWGIYWRGGPVAAEFWEVAGWLFRRGQQVPVAK
jgi:O-antigen/teichoic acid export membrane protein